LEKERKKRHPSIFSLSATMRSDVFMRTSVVRVRSWFMLCFFLTIFFFPRRKAKVYHSKSHRKMMFTKVGMRLASATLPGVRAGVGVPERRPCPLALPVSAAAGLIRVEPRHWAGMVVRGSY
jgi:hypothetical protein